MKKKGSYHSNQPGVAHAVSEFDNPRNKPSMGKGPSPVRKYVPHKEEPVTEGRAKTRKKRTAAILSKAKRGK